MLTLGGIAIAGSVFGLSACSPLVALNQWLVPEEGYDRHRGIAYGDDPRQRLDVYVPATVGAGKVAPVVVFFYGGGWKGGSRDYYPFVGQALVRLGYVVVVPDYRVYPQVRFPRFIEDAATAVQWVEQNIGTYGGDASAVVLMGHSAGAHIAAMLIADSGYLAAAGVDRRHIRGFIGLAGPYAFDPTAFRSTRPIFADADRPMMPLGLIDGREPPMLLLHGEDDGTVYPVNSETLAGQIWAMGGQVTLVEYPKKGHIDIILAMAPLFRDEDGPYGEIDRFLAATTEAATSAAGVNGNANKRPQNHGTATTIGTPINGGSQAVAGQPWSGDGSLRGIDSANSGDTRNSR